MVWPTTSNNKTILAGRAGAITCFFSLHNLNIISFLFNGYQGVYKNRVKKSRNNFAFPLLFFILQTRKSRVVENCKMIIIFQFLHFFLLIFSLYRFHFLGDRSRREHQILTFFCRSLSNFLYTI